MDLVEPEVRAGLENNPANRAEALRVRGTTALFSGRFQDAERFLTELRLLSAGQVSDWYMAMALYYEGETARAEGTLSVLHGSAQAERRAHATLASFLAARNEKQQADALLRAVTTGTYMDHHVAYSTGVAYAQLGEFAEARRWLSRSASTGFPCYPWFEADPLLRPIRADPEFRRFLDGMRQSWESTKARYTPPVSLRP
jgi:predicted Zn-dependent protease